MSARYSPVDEGHVSSRDISVVVQGPLQAHGRNINTCLTAIRYHLPEAEVIVSTWDGEDVSGLTGCRIVQQPDPGGIEDINGNIINLTRQTASTLAGLNIASRPWVLKTRVDVRLTGKAIAIVTRYGDNVPIEYRLFRRPLVVPSLFTRDPARVPFLFHPSDVVQFGLWEDMNEFWGGASFQKTDLFSADRPSMNPFGNYSGFTQQIMVPEQALMLRWLRTRGIDVTLNRPDAVCRRNAVLSERLLLANFRVIGFERAELDFPNHFMRVLPSVASIYCEEKVPEIARDAYERPTRRFVRIWLRKYLLYMFTPFWFVTAGNLLLHSISPRLAKHVRAMYRRVLGFQRDATR